MSTRGAYGFYKNKIHKVSYNHSDSYPDWLGNNILEFTRKYSAEDLNKFFDDIIMVDEHDLVKEGPALTRLIERAPTLMAKVMDAAPKNFGSGTKDWYYILREFQGDLEFDAKLGVMRDNWEFLHDGLFCEWAYIINLDKNVLEVYQGFFKKKPNGRYRNVPAKEGYYAVGLIEKYSLKNLPEKFSPETTPRLYADR